MYKLYAFHPVSASRKKIENVILQVQFSPLHPGKGQIATPRKALQIKYPTPRSERGGRMLKFQFELCISLQ